jgi:tetratricopeptide (TPR) repeat protein
VIDSVLYTPEAITLTFNIARLRESQRNYVDAISKYHALTQKYPDYTACACPAVGRSLVCEGIWCAVDCTGYIRLGCIQQASGDLNTAKQLFEKAFEMAPTEAARAGAYVSALVSVCSASACVCIIRGALVHWLASRPARGN